MWFKKKVTQEDFEHFIECYANRVSAIMAQQDLLIGRITEVEKQMKVFEKQLNGRINTLLDSFETMGKLTRKDIDDKLVEVNLRITDIQEELSALRAFKVGAEAYKLASENNGIGQFVYIPEEHKEPYVGDDLNAPKVT